MEKIDITIIGAGVIGLGIAHELSRTNQKILLIERHNSFGQETSSRNSEVIHAGIYYKNDSLKAKTSVEGRHLLYQLCEKENIPHKRIGKLIVATNSKEEASLNNLFKNARSNGVEDLKMLDSKDIKKIEPNIEAIAALYSPHTGIIDSHSLMRFLEVSSKRNGVDIIYNVSLLGIDRKDNGYLLKIKDTDSEGFTFKSRFVINSAGLESDKVAEMAGIDITKKRYNLSYCKGDYFRVSSKKASKVNMLIYPVPKKASGGLGIHLTPDLGGGLRLGPDHEYIERIDYNVNATKRSDFFNAVKGFLPIIGESDLSIDTAGVRPRLYKENEPERDYIIKEESPAGLPQFINLIGIESPGLTSTLSIAKLVKGLISKS